MAADDLSAPLGRNKKRNRAKIPFLLLPAVAGVLAACLLFFLLWAAFVDDPLGGEPIAVADNSDPLQSAQNPEGKTAEMKNDGPSPTSQTGQDPAPSSPAGKTSDKMPDQEQSPNSQTVTIIDGSSGNRTEVMVPGQG